MRHRRVGFAVLVLALAPALAACGSGSTAKGTRALDSVDIPKTITVTSPAFTDGGSIPRANTCDGPGAVPAISWTGVPAATKSVAVVVDDPDAAGGVPFLHWIVVGLAARAGTLTDGTLPTGASALDNGKGTLGWTPPCPPAGSGAHHYRFSVYALNDYVCSNNGDNVTGPGCSPPAAAGGLDQIRSTAIARGLLVGTYRR